MTQPFEGHVGRTYADSKSWWPPLETPPAGAPNVVIVLLDDVGYAQFGAYGSDIATPTFDRLASQGRRYANFHTTALCSPTRACLLTGRNHHSNGMARVVELAAGFPGYNATIPKENGFLSEILRNAGVRHPGHRQVAPDAGNGNVGGKPRVTSGRSGEASTATTGSWGARPTSTTRNWWTTTIRPNRRAPPRRATTSPRTWRTTPSATWPTCGGHRPRHRSSCGSLPAPATRRTRLPPPTSSATAASSTRDGTVGEQEVFARQLASGLLPAGTRLSERPSWVPAWETLRADEQRLAARLMEVYAGFLTHTDAQVARVLDFIEQLDETENTLVIVMSDNGASAEGGAQGSFNEQYFFNFIPESLEENLERIDDLGTPKANNHYPWGWAWAGNTPLKRFKRDTHEGGVADPLIFHWPARIGTEGGTRHQYVHAIDVLPTLLDLIGIDAPELHRRRRRNRR